MQRLGHLLAWRIPSSSAGTQLKWFLSCQPPGGLLQPEGSSHSFCYDLPSRPGRSPHREQLWGIFLALRLPTSAPWLLQIPPQSCFLHYPIPWQAVMAKVLNQPVWEYESSSLSHSHFQEWMGLPGFSSPDLSVSKPIWSPFVFQVQSESCLPSDCSWTPSLPWKTSLTYSTLHRVTKWLDHKICHPN